MQIFPLSSFRCFYRPRNAQPAHTCVLLHVQVKAADEADAFVKAAAVTGQPIVRVERFAPIPKINSACRPLGRELAHRLVASGFDEFEGTEGLL